jgi:Helitron helicase-like domain at N-terminus
MYIRSNLQQLRAECYYGIIDAFGANDSNHIVYQIILPATTIGSTRYMQQRFQDSMALVRKFGKSDLFLTLTYNPK